MPSHPMEVWILFAAIGAFGIVAVLYGSSCVLHHELSRIRLERKAREVYESYLRRLDAIARGEIDATTNVDVLSEDESRKHAA